MTLGARARSVLVTTLLGVVAGTSSLGAQELGPFLGYFQDVPTASGSSALAPGGVANLTRLRLMLEPSWDLFWLEIAYESALQLRQEPQAGLGASVFIPSSGTTWLPLQWTIVDDDHVQWAHRFDRLALGARGGKWEAIVGRQPISWATTLIFTPADPFAPFDPTDPFREFRAGVDAARFQYFPGPLSEVDFVIRPADTQAGTEMTALARVSTTWGDTDVSAWAGVIYDGPGLALAGSHTIGNYQLRAEASLREDPGSGAIIRGTVGVDRRFTLWRRDLYVILEYQHDGFGAASADELLAVAQSPPFQRGEMQVLGEDEAILQGAYQIHPLWSVNLQTLVNLRDGSGLVVPAAVYSITTDVVLGGGVFFSFGDDSISLVTGLGSEYGSVPVTGYLSIAWFF